MNQMPALGVAAFALSLRVRRSREGTGSVTRRIHHRRRRRDSHTPGLGPGLIVMRTNNADFKVAPRNLSLEPVTFRSKFHETISCGQLRNYSKRRSLPCGARAQFLLAQLGSGRSEWGANGERNRQTDEADKTGSRSTRKWNTVVGAAEVPLGGNKKASSTKIAALWELGIGPALVASSRKHSHALESSE